MNSSRSPYGLKLVRLSEKYQVLFLISYISISGDYIQMMRIMEDFSKFILQMVITPQKIPCLTYWMSYYGSAVATLMICG